MNKENIESPNQNIPVNCLHAVCPNCGKDVDVIPAKGTVIESPNVQEGTKGAPIHGILKETVEDAAAKSLIADKFNIETSFAAGYISGSAFGAKWQSQHSYTEAEVLAIIEQVKKAFADNSGSEVVAKSITDIDFKYLLK